MLFTDVCSNLDLYVDYSSTAVWTYMCSMVGIYIQGHMPNNVKCMYTSVSGSIIEFMRYVY